MTVILYFFITVLSETVCLDLNVLLLLNFPWGTYQVQTNLSVQTMQTSIWTNIQGEGAGGVGGGISKNVITQSRAGG